LEPPTNYRKVAIRKCHKRIPCGTASTKRLGALGCCSGDRSLAYRDSLSYLECVQIGLDQFKV
jgi:hypothetical protein